MLEERVLNHAVTKQASRFLGYDHQALLTPPSDGRLSPDVTFDRDRVGFNQCIELRLTRAGFRSVSR
ncbi:hypothetical protein OG298_40950 [Streptomyces sp. NBC_01005]|uniref:hypothetical protein n=1 Tax=Streptomyces sp. NBC_01650 TaxID=2975907 RepID=UPI00386FCB3D|nr:hypothetical protein OG298_40950 [Streptomyces sp. NBC_01005]WTC99716.1 hypothetical protein OH736_40960 [Streptomyces sp. NBC_01650]